MYMSKYNNGNHKNSSNYPKLYHFFSVPNLVLLPRFNILSFPFCSWFKVIADNTFPIPVLTNTVRIIDWTIEEIKDIDARTRKQLTMTGNFHPNGDVDILYLPR